MSELDMNILIIFSYSLSLICSVSHGGSRQAAAQVTLPNDYSSEHTLIGSRNDWLENFEIPDHWKVFAEQRGQFQSQVYEGEDVCIDGSTRKTLVLYECGVVNEVKEFRVGCEK